MTTVNFWVSYFCIGVFIYWWMFIKYTVHLYVISMYELLMLKVFLFTANKIQAVAEFARPFLLMTFLLWRNSSINKRCQIIVKCSKYWRNYIIIKTRCKINLTYLHGSSSSPHIFSTYYLQDFGAIWKKNCKKFNYKLNKENSSSNNYSSCSSKGWCTYCIRIFYNILL